MELPPREMLEAKLHEAIRLAREQVERDLEKRHLQTGRNRHMVWSARRDGLPCHIHGLN